MDARDKETKSNGKEDKNRQRAAYGAKQVVIGTKGHAAGAILMMAAI